MSLFGLLFDQVTRAEWDALVLKVNQILAKEQSIMTVVDDLVAAVAAEKTVEDSAVKLLQQLVADLQTANAISPADVQKVIDSVKANTQALADAVTANTPAAP
jgi:hypothetical protein